MDHPYLLECCVDSVQSAINAERGGADRLELCSALALGGLSPTVALFRLVRQHCTLPIHVLLRPRAGDFLYSEYEFAQILEEVKTFRTLGADGVVIGCLQPNGTLDLPRMRQLVAEAKPLSITLHRAFDVSADLFQSLEAAKELGIQTILTSGGKPSCAEGAAMLAALCARAGPVQIMAGSGVNAAQIARLAPATGIHAFHLSGKKRLESGMLFRAQGVAMGVAGQEDEYTLWQTDQAEIGRAAIALAQIAK